jgi:uncharacterized membrane protein YfcA
MDKKLGLIILIGLLIGGTIGILFEARFENPLLGVGLGALGGVFLTSFIAIALRTTKNASTNSIKAQPKSRRGMWIGIGLILGAGLGVAMQNIAVGMGIGVLMGVIMETLRV